MNLLSSYIDHVIEFSNLIDRLLWYPALISFILVMGYVLYYRHQHPPTPHHPIDNIHNYL